jgi:hypothetical protein
LESLVIKLSDENWVIGNKWAGTGAETAQSFTFDRSILSTAAKFFANDYAWAFSTGEPTIYVLLYLGHGAKETGT